MALEFSRSTSGEVAHAPCGVRTAQVGPSRIVVGAGRDEVFARDRGRLGCRQPVALVVGQLPESRIGNTGDPAIGGIADADEQVSDDLSSLTDEGDRYRRGDPQCGELVASARPPSPSRPAT